MKSCSEPQFASSLVRNNARKLDALSIVPIERARNEPRPCSLVNGLISMTQLPPCHGSHDEKTEIAGRFALY